MTIQHFYVFDGFYKRIPTYYRTCGYEDVAKRYVDRLRKEGKDAFYCTTLPREFWY